VVAIETIVSAVVAVFAVTMLLVAVGVGYAVSRLFGLDSSLAAVGLALGVNRWAALGPTVGGLAVLLFVEFRTDLPADGEPGDLAADIALFGVMAGAFALAVGIGNLPDYLDIRHVTPAMDATDRGGDRTVTVAGTAEAAGGETAAPLSGEPCLAWAVRVREHRGISRRGMRGLVHDGHGGVRFAVRDGTGQVQVDPEALPLEGWSTSIGTTGDISWRAADDFPERVVAYRDGHDLGAGPDNRVYEERRLVAGDEVTASGTVERTDGIDALGGDGFVRATDPGTLQRTLRRRVRAGAVGGTALVAGTVGLLFVTGLV
jgi:hypothetical protein